jgi:NADH-quinone oxidoreductase subunit L
VIAYWLGVVAAFMTAFYSGRVMFMTFYGKYRGDITPGTTPTNRRRAMLIPLYVLAAGATLSGIVAYGWFVGEGWEHFWGTSIAVKATETILHHMHEVQDVGEPAAAGRGAQRPRAELLLLFGQSDLPAKTVRAFKPLHALFYNKWYFDELYDAVFVQPS